jgi:hypothetical protein
MFVVVVVHSPAGVVVLGKMALRISVSISSLQKGEEKEKYNTSKYLVFHTEVLREWKKEEQEGRGV